MRSFPKIGKLVNLEEIQGAARIISGVARRTPLLVAADTPRSEKRSELRLKCENLQRGGAFKLRGAYHFVSRLPDDVRARGVVTYSSGNHGRAVALAAKEHGIPATVVVPVDAPAIKVDGILRQGAEVVKEGTTSEQRRVRAEEIAAARNLTTVPPFDHEHIIAGQGTVGLEIAEDWPEVERVVVPVGGGGLLAGIAAAMRALIPEARIYGVEPVGAPAMHRSLEAGEPVTLDRVETVADGLKPVRPGDLTFAHTLDLVDGVVLVDDQTILRGLAWLAEEARMLVEPSGAAAVAAVLADRVPDGGSKTAAIVSGGNVNPADWSRWAAEYRNGELEVA